MLEPEPWLFLLLLITGILVVQIKDLFAASMLTGIFSLLSAGLFTLMDAVDVAFTEASVGAGVSTVLFLSTLALTNYKEKPKPLKMDPFVVVVLTGAALVVGTLGMAPYGSPDTPVHTHVPAQIQVREHKALQDYRAHVEPDESREKAVGLPNVVTSILASYRGYDTLGETGVIFTAGVGVMLLLLGPRRRREDDGDDENAESSGPQERDDSDISEKHDKSAQAQESERTESELHQAFDSTIDIADEDLANVLDHHRQNTQSKPIVEISGQERQTVEKAVSPQPEHADPSDEEGHDSGEDKS